MEHVRIFWFRRDLRLHDNHGLYEALSQSVNVLPIFIFDKNILDLLPADDTRLSFIYATISDLKGKCQSLGSDLKVFYGDPVEVWQQLIATYPISDVYLNRDYEPYAKKRDEAVKNLLLKCGVNMHTFKDHVIFENEEVRSKTGTTYTVFTPYKNSWLGRFEEEYLRGGSMDYPSHDRLHNLSRQTPETMMSLASMGFKKSSVPIPDVEVRSGVIKNYGNTRNFPANTVGTSRLGIHFRFGTVSIRDKAIKANALSQVYLSELIWRDFYSQILDAFPHVVTGAFKPQYDKILWRENEEEFERWCHGMTGYPIVDAGMRELNATGHMHNRVRMITASFLTKHLLMDWRLGEAYFALKLLDFDLASNNGGWQWAAGSGTDAAPYFRIFNPYSQAEKFDSKTEYIKQWVPEYGTRSYPNPIVDHKYARERCLETYKKAFES